MASNKRRKALGSDPLEGAASAEPDAPAVEEPAAAEPAAAEPPAAEPPAAEPPAAEPVVEAPAAEAPAPDPTPAEAPAAAADSAVPPAPDLRPVPPRGAVIPNDRMRTLAVVLLLALVAALWAQQANRLDAVTEELVAAEGQLEEFTAGQESARARADALQAILADSEARVEYLELEAAESQASISMLEHALHEFSRASSSRDQRARLTHALDLLRSDLGVAQRWPVTERPQILSALDSGDTQRLGRSARPEELAALRGDLPVPTITALAEASDGMRPWRRLVDDAKLEPHPSSPDRGVLLTVLLDHGVSAASLAPIPFEGADLSRMSLGAADLTGLNLPGADLRGTDLSRCKLAEIDLTGALYNDSTRWPQGFNPTKAGAVTQPAVPKPSALEPGTP